MIKKAYFFEWWFWFKFNNSQQWERGLQLKVNFFCRLISSFWEDGVKWKILEVNLWKKYFLQIFLQLLPLFYTKQNKTQLEEGKNRQFWKNQISQISKFDFYDYQRFDCDFREILRDTCGMKGVKKNFYLLN